MARDRVLWLPSLTNLVCFTYCCMYVRGICLLCLAAGLRRKGALVADGELQRIMASVDLDGNNTLDFQVGAWGAAP